MNKQVIKRETMLKRFKKNPVEAFESLLSKLEYEQNECERLEKEIDSLKDEKKELNNKIDSLQKEINKSKMLFKKLGENMFRVVDENEQLRNFHINLIGADKCEIREVANLKCENQKLKGALLDVLQVSMGELILGFGIGNSAFNKINKICTEVLTKDDEVKDVQDNL